MACTIEHWGGWVIKLIFLNVSRFRVDIGGGMHSIELGEWMISPKVDGFIAFDELKNLLWECESIVVEAVVPP